MTDNSALNLVEEKTKNGIFCRKTFTESSKETIVLIMGYGGSLHIWPPSFVEKLASKYTVITYDNRGTGQSIIPEKTADYSIKVMADDVYEVTQLLGSQAHHVLGFSMGSCIALQYAHDHAQSVKSLFLMCGTAGGALYEKPEKEISTALANPQGNNLWDIYVSTWKLMFSQAELERHHPVFLTVYENSKHLPTQLLALAGHSHAFKGFDGTTYLADLKMPTTILGGKNDRLMPPKNSENLAKQITGSRLILIDDCEHGPHIQNEETVLAEIDKNCALAGGNKG